MFFDIPKTIEPSPSKAIINTKKCIWAGIISWSFFVIIWLVTSFITQTIPHSEFCQYCESESFLYYLEEVFIGNVNYYLPKRVINRTKVSSETEGY